MEKLLPVKVFQKRKVDEQLTEAGGSKTMPKWVLHDDELTHHSEQLIENVATISDSFEEHKEAGRQLPMIITTTIIDEAIAKTHRSDVVNLLNSDNQPNVIGLDSDMPTATASDPNQHTGRVDPENLPETRKIISMVTSDELLHNIERALSDTQGSAKLISAIASVDTFDVHCSDYNPENRAYRVILHDYNSKARNDLARQLFKNQCKTNGIMIDRETRYSSEMYMYRITLDSADELDTVRKFEGIFSIEETRPIYVSTDDLEGMTSLAVKVPKEGVSYPSIGVLDSGIIPNYYLASWLLPGGEKYYPEELQDKSHGSMVASIVEYSDELNGTSFSSTDGVMMLEALVIPDQHKETFYAEDLLDNVRNAIERHKEIKVWTMSAGAVAESALDSFSTYGVALDNIADENDVLIIKSAGNSTSFIQGKPVERIAQMADSVRALVIGSIAGARGKYDLAGIDAPSPFSRCGPGPAYVIKPDLVAYGGNAGVDPNGKLVTTGVKVIGGDGTLATNVGTSFSTPWVARIAAELNYLLDGEFDPLLIKALMIHNATYPIGGGMAMDEKKKFMGFGMPAGTRDILYNSEHEITLILRDFLEKGSYINILDFPYPESLVDKDGLFRGQIIVTMVSSPILRPGNGPEYCQSDVKVSFGTMDGVKERDTSKRTIRNPYGPNDNQNLLADDLYQKKVFDVLEPDLLADESFARERTLLRLGQKFRPIKKYAIDLADMKNASKKKYLSGKRQWYMKIEGLFRDAIEREAKATGEILCHDFCVIITIRDPEGKAPVYNEVTQQLQQKNFVYSNVQLKNEIREHVHVEEESNG